MAWLSSYLQVIVQTAICIKRFIKHASLALLCVCDVHSWILENLSA